MGRHHAEDRDRDGRWEASRLRQDRPDGSGGRHRRSTEHQHRPTDTQPEDTQLPADDPSLR
ncbi:hypothetical protein FB470_007051 [Amycolatopsis thermophila]|uniref:Uncharacterized protein n=1 Tax=Amycolatopsis thermophila TaxID=206084 RepID=A0ABU0F632_9PSEU|nr:hypothetical protein [Amycolatopsis thermophila]